MNDRIGKNHSELSVLQKKIDFVFDTKKAIDEQGDIIKNTIKKLIE